MWSKMILDSADVPVEGAPGFPPAAVQQLFVGRSGRSALEEVVPFVEIIKKYNQIDEHASAAKILDFGVGWGRIARFFQKSISPDNLYLADVDEGALRWCDECGVKGTRIHVAPTGTLPIAGNSLDCVYSYSVFSHLAESAAMHWLNEIARVLKPDSVFVFTTQSLRFLHLVRACHDKRDASDMERAIGMYLGPNPQNAIDRYEAGNHAYSDQDGVGGGGVLSGEFYGWAAIPPAWFDRHFGKEFALEEYIDDPARFEQAVYIVRKR
jgi:SAM-dependent methyltransferase